MSIPTFIDISELGQALELKLYLKKLGADVSEENTPGGLFEDLKEIVNVFEVMFKENKEADTEASFNSLLTLLFMLQPDEKEALVPTVCEKLTDMKTESTDKSGHLRVRLLQNFLFGFDETNAVAYNVYIALVKVAGQRKCLHMLDVSLDKVKSMAEGWKLTPDQLQHLYRKLHEALKANKRSEEAMKVMVELLGLCPEDKADSVKEEARACIVACIRDPDCLLFDHLLDLKPVQQLGDEKIQSLLSIFVSGTLADYNAFRDQPGNAEYLSSMGLSDEDCVKKMRIVTFISMANKQKDITYDQLSQDTQVPLDDIELFMIDVIETGKVRARLDQLARKVNIQYAVHRQFVTAEWNDLSVRLCEWKKQLHLVQHNLDQLRNIQLVPQ